MKMWNLFLAFLPVLFFFFLLFLLVVLGAVALKTSFRADVIFDKFNLKIQFLRKKNGKKWGGSQYFHPQTQQAATSTIAGPGSRWK
jgi:hypothetical protein